MSAVEHELERVEALARLTPSSQRRTYELLLVNANDSIRDEREFPGIVYDLLADDRLADLFQLALVHEAQRAVVSASRHVNRRFAAEFERAERLSHALWATGHAVIAGEPDFAVEEE